MEDAVIQQYRERQDELTAESRTIMAAADAEKRDLSSDELDQIKANSQEFNEKNGLIHARQEVLDQEEFLARPQGRVTEPDDMPPDGDDDDGDDTPPQAAATDRPQSRPNGGAQAQAQQKPKRDSWEGTERPRRQAKVIGDRARLSGTHGFRSFGDFVMSVKSASVSRGVEVDNRLKMAAATTYGNESAGADGGFSVPPDFRTSIMEKAFGEDSLMARTDRMTSSGNSMTFPTDMTTPWGTDGIAAYWEQEAGTYTQSKPVLQEVNLRLHKLTALVPMTEELLDDAPAMGSYVNRKAAEKVDFKVSNAIVRGSGAGQPLGYLNSNCLVTQASETSQVADTINAQNVAKMWSRMPVQSRRNSVWLIHPDAEPQLHLMTLGDHPIYLPPGGFSNSMFGTLMGRPVIPHQVCETVGDLGDLQLVDLTSYVTVVKSGGLRSQTSIHLWFDQDLTAFKFTLRIAGQPWWSEATSSRDGSFTLSPFVVLAAR